MEHLIYGLGSDPPIILGVHHPLNLLGSDNIFLLVFLSFFLLVHFEVIIMDI